MQPPLTPPESGSTTPEFNDNDIELEDSRGNSIPPTPGDGGIHFTSKRAMASFDNLVALANYQERLKDARKVIWRDRGESVQELTSLKECFEHAAKGGLRMFFFFLEG